MLQLTDAQRFRDNYWIDAGEVSSLSIDNSIDFL